MQVWKAKLTPERSSGHNTEIGHPGPRLSCLSAVSCLVSVSVTSMPLWPCAKSESEKKKKKTEGEGETDTQHFNSFIRLDTSCMIYTKTKKHFQDTHVLNTLYKDFIP